ncbi:MAG: rhodanese-like domain-containing protein [Gammaproteobacteria bacterium]|nr:rhodanese-like domain-containing protein [Gammaproteobacteria bacterium]
MRYTCSALPTSVVMAFITLLMSSNTLALEVKITQDMASMPVHHGDDFINIQRIQDQDNILTGGYTKTSRKCPPFCIQPLHVAPGVITVAELELLEFIDKKLEIGNGVLIDARTPAWYQKSTIPGSINIPFTHFDPEKSVAALADVLLKLNVHKKGMSGSSFMDSIRTFFSGDANAADSPWDFSQAKEILLYCNGIWCGQSPHAIKNLLSLGYPPEKIYYYRGGMQAWQSLGLTIVVPK